MILNTIQLKRFYANSSQIKSKGILPILDYIKISDDVILKTNTEAFIKMDITPTGKTFLIDENTLGKLLSITKSDIINVEVKDKRVCLNDGFNKAYFPLPDYADLYPEIPEIEKKEGVVLTESVLKSIGIASKNVAVGDVRPALNCVNLHENFVFGTDTFKFYSKKFDNLPSLSISPLAASIISQFGSATYYSQGNFNIFEIGSLVYGFAKEEVVVPDFVSFLKKCTKDEYMEMEVETVLSFIDFLQGTTSSKSVTCNFDGNKVSFHDADLDKGNDVELETTGKFEMKKSFLPRLISPLLKSIGKEYIRFSPMQEGQKGVTVWSDAEDDLLCILAEVEQN
jgi:hypothetical protein